MINNLFSRVRALTEELGTSVTPPAFNRKVVPIITDTPQLERVITNKKLYKKISKLFNDGHHARAVEEAYKLLDNTVKTISGLSELSGANLMNTSFSANTPLLCFNANVSVSEKDEQKGYMQILSGCMTGIRNPRAHESDWEDSEATALQLLIFANHLMEKIDGCIYVKSS